MAHIALFHQQFEDRRHRQFVDFIKDHAHAFGQDPGHIVVKTAAGDVGDAVQRQTESFIDRVYKGSVSLLINSLTEKQKLSREDIDELQAILKRAEEEMK